MPTAPDYTNRACDVSGWIETVQSAVTTMILDRMGNTGLEGGRVADAVDASLSAQNQNSLLLQQELHQIVAKLEARAASCLEYESQRRMWFAEVEQWHQRRETYLRQPHGPFARAVGPFPDEPLPPADWCEARN